MTKVGLPNGVPKILEEIELSRAIFELYEGGVVRHHSLTTLLRSPTQSALPLVHASRPDIYRKDDEQRYAASDRCIG